MDGEALRLKHAGLICCGLLLLLFGLARLGGLGFPLETPLPAEARHSSRRAKAGQPAQAPAALASQQALEIDGERVEILRDSFGVPHIFAKTLRGLFFGNGYAIAQDRLWQMERYRRTARGELAELEGEGAIRQDEDVRRLGYTEEERRLRWAELSAEIQAIFTAYAEGVNAYIRQAIRAGKLPEEFAKRGLAPQPWQVTDSLAIGDMMSNRFGTGGGNEIQNLRILNKLRERFGSQALAVFNDLFWQDDPRSPTTIPGEQRPAKRRTAKPQRGAGKPAAEVLNYLAGANDSVLERVQARAEGEAILEAASRYALPTKFGSYAWLLAPQRTASGFAILVGGPQMGFSTPQIAHEVHLSGVGWNVIGMGFAGLPGVLIGHNDYLAWTSTSGLTDMVDIFAEKLDPQDRYRYFYNGEWREMEKRLETIRVRGSNPRQLEVYRTVHGPVIEWDESTGVAYARAASFRGQEHHSLQAFLGFNRARTPEEFARSVALIWPSHNLFCATVDGAIGFWHAGKPPIRARGIDPRLPVPGTGEYDWQGFVEFERMPRLVNPPGGAIVNWNNKPAPGWPNGDRPVWGEIFRVHRIVELLEARKLFTFEQARALAVAIADQDANADYLKPYLLNAIQARLPDRSERDARLPAALALLVPSPPRRAEGSGAEGAGLREAAEYLAAWDNRATEGSVAKLIFDTWLDLVRDAVFLDDLGDFGDRRLFNRLCQPSLLLHVFQGTDSGVPPSRDYFNGRKRDDVIVEALEKALAQLAAKHGSQMNLWGYKPGELNLKPLPSLPAAERGTYIQIVELSQPVIRGESILPPGQSEDPRSPHYSDQRELAGWWKYKLMLYRREQLGL